MENLKKFTERIEAGVTAESIDTEVQNIIDSSLGVLKNSLYRDKEIKIHELEYRKYLLETLRKNLNKELFDLKYGDIQTAIDLIDSEIQKLDWRYK